MRRHEALTGLSRDHHQALACALLLKRADMAGAEAARSAFLSFWHDHGQRHFRAEEEVLLPAFAAYGDPDSEAAKSLAAAEAY